MQKWLCRSGGVTMPEPRRYTLLLYLDDESDNAIAEWLNSLPLRKRQNDVKAALLRGIQQQNAPQPPQPPDEDDDTFTL
jgi:hypothetical protein